MEMDIEAIERATFEAVRPQQLVEIPGWLVGLDDGTVGRAHSAAPLRHEGIDPASVPSLQRIFAKAGREPVFRVPRLPAFDAVRTALAATGASASKPTLTMVGTVAGVTAHTEQGDRADLELLLLPLAHVGHTRIRAIGVLAPLAPPYWLGARPAGELTLGALRHIETDIGLVPRIVRAATGSRVRHGFVVYSGGRTPPSGERSG